MKKSIFSILTFAVVLAVVSACSTKKNTAASRNYQAFITRYNVYFNGKEHYDETLADMESRYEDDYSRELPVHPADVRGNRDFAQPGGSFTRSTEKAQKSIQLHSIKKRPRREPGRRNDPEYQAWLRREEYNPFLHNAWMLLAESQFMDGDFLGAASTFFYITNHFSWLPATVTEARIWQARCYCAAGRVNEADAVLGRIKERDLTSANLRGFYAFVRSATALARGNYRLAMEWLPGAVDWVSGQEKRRLRYLLGQVYMREGRYEEARREFEKIEKSVSAPHSMRFNARIRKSEAVSGAATDRRTMEGELNSLRRLTRYESNSAYLDQIHYAMGNISLSLGDTAQAINSYTKGVALSQRRSTDMAIAAAALGNLYYEMSDYDKSQPYMAQAVAILPENYPDIKRLKEKSDLLDKLAVYSTTIRTNDSLLRLSSLPPSEIYAVIDHKIDSLRKVDRAKEKDMREALSANSQSLNGMENSNNSPHPPASPTPGDGSWYFYNRALIEAGKQEFRRRWGDRKPEDNWRLSERNTVDLADIPTPDPTTFTPAAQTVDSLPDAYSREYYLRDIPFEPSQKEKLRQATATALYEMGLLLKDYLEDFPAARKPLMRFLDENPGDERRKDVYYNMFLMAMLENNPVEGNRWRRRIVEEYPGSNEGIAMADERFLENLKEMNQRQENLYEETYTLYLANDNAGVRKNAAYAREHFQMSPLQPKFMFLDALTYVTDGNAEEFARRLKEIAERYPQADVAPLSSSWLQGLESGRELMKSDENLRGWLETRLVPDSAAASHEEISSRLEFTFSDDGPHLVLVTFAVNEIDPNNLLFETARYNFTTFSVRDFDLALSVYGNLGIIKIGGFADSAEAERYHTLISGASPEVIPLQAQIIVISESDYNLLLHGGRTLIDYLNALSRKDDARVHEAVLPPDEYPSAEEMYDELPELEPADNDTDNE